ncbi:MAG TPA: hypothetical protein PLH61_07910 [Bacteroidia bacterium]|nr:hypothetical protein [Bacteroidia bacterium]
MKNGYLFYSSKGKQALSHRCAAILSYLTSFGSFNDRNTGVTKVLFQRAVAARRRWLFPEVEEFSRCKFFSGNDFNSNGKKQTRPESSPASTLHVSGSVSFYRFRSHRSIRKNLRRTIRFE